MSTQRIFDDIMNQFNSDEEEEDEENETSKHSEEIKQHKKTSSLGNSSKEQIKEKLCNTSRDKINKDKIKNRKRDEFGYFINDDENGDDNNDDNENEEKSDSNENKEESSVKKENAEEEIEEKDNNNIEEENNENNNNDNEEENDENNNNDNEEENNENNNNEEENKENELEQSNNNEVNNENINDNGEKIENNDKQNEEENLYEERQEQKDEENDIINEMYNNKKTENNDQPEIELFRSGSFRPKPIPGSPKFSKNSSQNNEIIADNNEKKTNSNLVNFTETIETTIEGDKVQNKEMTPNNQNNRLNLIYTHNNNFISLGKIPSLNLQSSNNIETYNKSSNKNSNKNSNNIVDNQDKKIENEDKAEEEFLKREELKLKDSINEIENNTINKKDEEEGKENVTDDEEDIKNKKNEDKNNLNQNAIIEDSKEYNPSNSNTISNENDTARSNNNENDIKVISIKLLEQMQNTRNSHGNIVNNSPRNDSSKKNKNINNIKNKNIGYNKNIYAKKNAKDINIIKNNKKNNNQINKSKRDIYESPSDKSMKKNNINYSTDQISSLSTNKKITPFNYNNISNFSKQITNKKKEEYSNIKKNLIYVNDNSNVKNYSKKLNNSNKPEKYPFKPEINERSQEILKRRLSNNKNILINNNENEQDRQKQKTPIGLQRLYEDANNKKEKLNKEHIRQNNEILSRANSKKINDKSYKLLEDRNDRRIKKAIKKFEKKENKLNIVGMTQCLYELNMINELIKPKDNLHEINMNNQLDLTELQAMAESVNSKDIKKSIELELIEQLWYFLNPQLNPEIDSKLLLEFLKFFLCGEYGTNLESLISSFLEQYKINNNEKKEYQSPLRDKKYEPNEIWSKDRLIQVFLYLKNDLKAYRENDNTKGDLYNKIIKEKDKELTFEPDLVSSKYFYRYSQFQYNKDNSIMDLINKYKNNNKNQKEKQHDFNKVYERFKAEKELHEKTLKRIREMQEEKELKMCTKVPKVNNYIPKSRNDSKCPTTEKRNKTIDIEERILNKNKRPRYKILYDLRKKFDKNDKNENKLDKSDIVDENCTFKPIICNIEEMNRTFSNIKNRKKPKGFNDYVDRNRALLEKKEYEKKLEEDRRYGRNYDKLKKVKIKPLNINYLNYSNQASPKKNNNVNKYQNYTESNRKSKFNPENEIIENIYITLDIKTPNGIAKPLKIYNKNDNSVIEDVSNFCRIYNLNEEIKKLLINRAIKYKNNFFNNNKEKFINEINREIFCNTYKKNDKK